MEMYKFHAVTSKELEENKPVALHFSLEMVCMVFYSYIHMYIHSFNLMPSPSIPMRLRIVTTVYIYI